MAVTITYEQAASTQGELRSQADRFYAEALYDACVAVVEKFAPDAPDAVQNEALIRMYGHLGSVAGGVRSERVGGMASSYDAKQSINALKHSGAAALLSHWRSHGFGPSE